MGTTMIMTSGEARVTRNITDSIMLVARDPYAGTECRVVMSDEDAVRLAVALIRQTQGGRAAGDGGMRWSEWHT